MRARLIAASNRDLEQEVAAGRFRADLYYRLNVVAFQLPPLRERPEVVPDLARRFLMEFAARHARQVVRIAPAALRTLGAHHWPGNIRELRNVVERAVALCAGPEIDAEAFAGVLPSAPPSESLPDSAASPVAGTLRTAKATTEIMQIIRALRNNGNNRARAAAELGISRVTLYSKLRLHGLNGNKVDELARAADECEEPGAFSKLEQSAVRK
jgi:DNA-binding NtrC family response regulator